MKKFITLLGMTGLNIQLFADPQTDSKIRSGSQSISNDISDELTLINPNTSQIISHILRGGRIGTASSTTIEWVDTYERKTNSTLKVALNAGATEIQVVDADVLVKDALLK